MSKDVEQKRSIPADFLCPISLDIMKDPVTLCTGRTYDRASIERWLASGHRTCPITMVKLTTCDLIPNHTVRRLIQDYHLISDSFGLKKEEDGRADSEAMEVDDQELSRIVAEMQRGDRSSMEKSLQILCYMARESVNNRCRIADAGAVPVFISLIVARDDDPTPFACGCHDRARCGSREKLLEGMIRLLSLVPLRDEERRAIADPRPLDRLIWILHSPSTSVEVKVHAARLLRKIAVIHDVMVLLGHVEGVFSGLVALIHDDAAGKQGLKSSFKALFQICLPHCNRQRAVQAHVIAAIIQTLPIARRKNTERGLAVISLLCTCDEGRLAVLTHPCAISFLLQTLNGSKRAAESAIAILWSAVSLNANPAAAEQTLRWLHKQADPICSELVLLLHGDYTPTAKSCAIHLLKTLKGSCSRSNISGLDLLDP